MSKRRLLPLALLLVVLILVVIRLALPPMARDAINARLADMNHYKGQVERVGLAVWRGAYSLHGLRVDKTTGEVPVPLLLAPRIDIALSWRHLFRGVLVAEVVFDQPVLHLVDGRTRDDSLSGAGEDWRKRLDDLVPTRVDEVRVADGTVVFHNFVSDPPVDLETTDVNARIRNLTNVRDADGRRVAEMEATATVFRSANLEADARFDPFGRMDEFVFGLRVTGIDLTRINDLAQAYANLDFESGDGELVVELEASDGRLSGYAKPLFQQLRIFSWGDVRESDKNPFQLAWEAVVEGVTTVFSNRLADQFGTRIEISGDLSAPDLGVFGAIVGVLRNAFVEALTPYFEGTRLRPRERD